MVYFDIVLAMGLTSAPCICQQVTNATSHAHTLMAFWIMNYVDDMIGSELAQSASQSYWALKRLLRDIEVKEAEEKACKSSTVINCLSM